MVKLWQTDGDTLPAIHDYTVGDDYIIDNQLLPYDILGSLAHAQMLEEMGVITKSEFATLAKGLNEILSKWKSGAFNVSQKDEDVHTAIENYLSTQYPEVGKKIHTGRSRNDQVLVMLRLYSKEQLKQLLSQLRAIENLFRAQASTYKSVPMPGYTHLQRAMPTTVGMWLGSYADAYQDTINLVEALQILVDQNPLGSASGFGIKEFPIKKETTTKLLGFARIQENPMYAGLSRGLFESAVLNNLSMPMALASRFACDMLIFTTAEFGFFSLPDNFTTGSSIMPNKRNYDVFEIMRANIHVYQSYQQQVQSITSSIGSGFQRDLQLTKKPYVQGISLLLETLKVLNLSLNELQINKSRLKAAMSDDLYATAKVYELVAKGVSFRDAYRKVKENITK